MNIISDDKSFLKHENHQNLPGSLYGKWVVGP